MNIILYDIYDTHDMADSYIFINNLQYLIS